MNMNMQKNFKRIIGSFLVISFVLIISGCGCKQKVETFKLDLEVWGVVDDSDAYQEIFNNYRKINPNIKSITYKKQRIETYQADLIEAMASGHGPDIFMIHNDWLGAFQDKILPVPSTILTEQRFRQNFVDVCVDDFVTKDGIFAVPLSVNTLGLYYNKDLFNVAGITMPPKTWEEFSADAARMTKINDVGEIIQSGAAMGTAYNINRSTDILNMLMFQNELVTKDSGNRVSFGTDGSAAKALDFYTKFADSNSDSYTWNPSMHYSIDAFSEGTLAMMFNYSWQVDVLKSKSPKLNFDVVAVPQVSDATKANFANYWAFAVSKNKFIDSSVKTRTAPVSNDLRVKESWKLLSYLTTKGEASATPTSSGGLGNTYDPKFDPAAVYLEKTKQPAARRDLIEKQKTDPDLGFFAEGTLVAKDRSKTNPVVMETVFAEMIDSVNKGITDVSRAVSDATRKLNELDKK